MNQSYDANIAITLDDIDIDIGDSKGQIIIVKKTVKTASLARDKKGDLVI